MLLLLQLVRVCAAAVLLLLLPCSSEPSRCMTGGFRYSPFP